MGMPGTTSALTPFPGSGISFHSCSHHLLILQGKREDALKRALSHVSQIKEGFPLLEEISSPWMPLGFAFLNFQEHKHPRPTDGFGIPG